jgi:nicotinamidase-related amidase
MEQPKSVLLVMDVQQGIISRLGDRVTDYLERVKRAVEAAHQVGIPVYFIVVRFRKGAPEMSPDNKMFTAFKNAGSGSAMDESSPNTQPVITPGENDLVIAKKRISAFAGSDLAMILRAQGIKHLVLCGVSTSGVVLSTLRQAADKDYILTVLSDGCLDHDEEVHGILMDKIFPRQAEVMTVDAWVKSLGK